MSLYKICKYNKLLLNISIEDMIKNPINTAISFIEKWMIWSLLNEINYIIQNYYYILEILTEKYDYIKTEQIINKLLVNKKTIKISQRIRLSIREQCVIQQT